MEKLFTIRVGRTDHQCKDVQVMCEEDEVENIAMVVYNYSRATNEFGRMPYALVYSEGKSCTFWHPGQILLDCM